MKESYTSLFLLFLRFGLLAWGGPVAQIGMIRDELVERRGWIAPDKFRRVLAVYQALPGPEAHELCVYFGMNQRGRIGGFLAGLGFMLPGLLLMLLLSWAYTAYGATVLLPLFVGVTPTVAALVIRALHRIGGHVLHGRSLIAAGVVSIILTLVHVHFLLVFAICAVWQALWASGRKPHALIALVTLTACALALTWLMLHRDGPTTATFITQPLFLEGLKAGLFSFGGAYTVIPFLQDSMVGAYPTITQQDFLNGIALANIIPAPLVIFGTYLGFLAGGINGALLVTAGIFLPAFAFTLLGHKPLERLIENPALHGLLDGISAGVVGLFAVTALHITLQAVTTPLQFVIFTLALTLLYVWKWRWSIPVLILCCGLLGYVLTAV